MKKSHAKEALALLNAQLGPKTLDLTPMVPKDIQKVPLSRPKEASPVRHVAPAATPTAAEKAAVPKGKSVISRTYKQAAKTKAKDWVSLELEELALSGECSLADVARENGFNFRWSHLNQGMQRMNLGNVLRGMQKHGQRVTINGRTEHATRKAA